MFPQNLKYLRNKAKLSQESIAKSLSMTRPTYVNLEAGSRSPSLDELHKLASIFEVEIEDLIQNRDLSVVEQIVVEVKTKQSEEVQPAPEIKFDQEKLKATLGYVISQVGALPNIGKTVIYKLLYFIDFDYYENNWQSITGLTYIHNHFGPTPEKDTFTKTVNEMIKDGDLQIIEVASGDYLQKRYILKRKVDLTSLNGQELQQIDLALSRLRHMTAGDITKHAQQDVPWLVTKPDQPIDYLLAHYRTSPTSTTNQ